MLADVAWARFRDLNYVSRQFKRIQQLEDPEQFRRIALELHGKLMQRDPDDRLIEGDSRLVPREIKNVQPVSILASEHYLSIKMTHTGDSVVVIYPSESTFGRVSSYRIAKDFYYWGRRK